jgi:hypothetical protein
VSWRAPSKLAMAAVGQADIPGAHQKAGKRNVTRKVKATRKVEHHKGKQNITRRTQYHKEKYQKKESYCGTAWMIIFCSMNCPYL